jgi:hypothetical protein
MNETWQGSTRKKPAPEPQGNIKTLHGNLDQDQGGSNVSENMKGLSIN